jgi:alkylation response protein AidB-like acyl-CoA dehydrogenase
MAQRGMHIGLDDDRRALRDSARTVLAAESPPAVTRQAYDDATVWQPLWKTLVDLGWAGAGATDGDQDAGIIDLVVLVEQAGAATVPAPLLSTAGLAAGALRSCGAAAEPLLAELSEGAVGALAVGEVAPADGNTLTVDGDRLRGRVAQVRDAERAEVFVAIGRDGEGADCVVVTRRGPGVNVTPGESLDPAAPVGAVEFDADVVLRVAIPKRQALVVPLVVAAAELLGVADRALSMSVDYAKSRHQFGQPIGAFQAVKHRLADCYVALERARSLTYYAAASCTPDGVADPETWRLAILAKAAANDAATLATRSAVAVHGAIAQTWEHDAHLLLRRAWLGAALLGDSRSLYLAAGRDYLAAIV